jgi:hypothetical protein
MSGCPPLGASTSSATLRGTMPRRSATFSARDRIRWTFSAWLPAFPARSIFR